jgi:predicted nucleotidyltransferase
MQIHNVLDRIMNHEVKTKILRIMFKYNTEWTGRQLAKELKVSPTTANKFLRALVNEGVINVKGAGKSYIYSLNVKNYIVKNILKQVFEIEKDLYSAVINLIKKAILKSNIKIEAAAIFGSVAQKTETTQSDIDLLIVLHELKDKKKIENIFDKLSTKIAEDFQTAISPYIVSKEQFKKRHRAKKSIINEILKSYILIIGKPLERIII